ncbi:MAG TPA: glycosyltransferase family 4 protein [Vicinamibacterales bacterium]|nr:glycosyltransferase family 4 protein [Vicinamibacterales bacterium]
MRVLVATSSPPFVDGGHLVIARELARACRASGHEAALVVTPQNRFGRQGAAYLASWLTDVGVAADGGAVDHVISLRYPAFAVRHPRHTCWLNHTMREYYDLWPQFSASLSRKNRIKEGVRQRLIHAADRYCLTRGVQRRFAISGTVQARLLRWGGIDAAVLHPPAPARTYRCDGYGDYIFAVSRLTSLKRFDLLLDALAQPAAGHVKAVIAGDGEARADLAAQCRRLGLESRVRFVGRLDDDALLGHLARCRAVAFVPFDEDYGFVTTEAFASGKAIVTCTDSGGPTELVTHEATGLLCAPTPAALADGLARLLDDRAGAERMGQAARSRGAELTWPATVARLLDEPAAGPV